MDDEKKLNARELKIAKLAFAAGYEFGHNDTVEGVYAGADGFADEWVDDAAKDGTFDQVLE